ncbi:hypothetical protein ABKN59_001912 [Abortiporus biennis]
MHLLRSSLPLSLFAFVSFVAAAQVPLSQQPTITSTNLVDALSADEDYTSLLRLLQTAKLIPTLNKLNGSTFFAPTNDAIKRHAASRPLWMDALREQSELRDNVQDKLRQELFYHLLNYTLEELPSSQTPKVLKTLHYPRIPVEPPSNEPPPYPPWLPTPGGSLGDSFGNGGAEIVKPLVNASNGLLFGIGNVLDVPQDLTTVIYNHPSLTYLSSLLNPGIASFLNSTPQLTLFLPVDSAWNDLPDYERLYLESDLASDDLIRIVNMHAVARKDVIYSESFKDGLNLTTVDGPELHIESSGEKTTVSSAELVQSDIYASNGVIHTVSSLLIPPGTLQLTPEKYLVLANCSSFVSLIRSVNLTHLINDTETHWTILAPRDDVISMYEDGELPERGSDELKSFLQYHFIPGKHAVKKLQDGLLLETALEEPGLNGGKQVLSVEVSEHKKNKDDLTVRFGGAGIIGDPVDMNTTIIYHISRPLVPPVDPLQTALPSLDLSSFLAAVFSTSLAEKLKIAPRTSFLIPHNSAFKRLGMLVSSHLLSASSKPDLERVIQHHILDTVEYSHSLQNGSQHTFSTLEGSDVQLNRHNNGTILLKASGGWADMHSELYTKNTLTQTGVIHEVSDIMIPRSVELTVGKLVKAAKATTMTTMVTKAGLDWILNGTAPPEGSPWADLGLDGIGWTLLCPTDDAFKEIKLTELYADEDRLQAIVAQHLIPMQRSSDKFFDNMINNRPLNIDDESSYSTLLTSASESLFGDVVFRQLEGTEQVLVGIKGARGDNGRRDWARVLSWGRSTTGGGTGGVIEISHVLFPYAPSWWHEYGPPLGVGAIGVLLICLFFYGVRIVWRRDTSEATYEPIGGFGRNDDES